MTTLTLCPFCNSPMSEDMSVLVDLAGDLTLVCDECNARAEEAANVGDPDDD